MKFSEENIKVNYNDIIKKLNILITPLQTSPLKGYGVHRKL